MGAGHARDAPSANALWLDLEAAANGEEADGRAKLNRLAGVSRAMPQRPCR